MPVRIERPASWQLENGVVAVQHAVAHRLMIFEMEPEATQQQRQAIVNQVKAWMTEELDDEPARTIIIVCDSDGTLVDVVNQGAPHVVAFADQMEAAWVEAMSEILE